MFADDRTRALVIRAERAVAQALSCQGTVQAAENALAALDGWLSDWVDGVDTAAQQELGQLRRLMEQGREWGLI